MTYKTFLISTVAILSLAACDSGEKDDRNVVKQESATQTSAASDAMGAIVEKVKDAVKLDTSSIDAFKTSLADMKNSLSDSDKSKLTSALGNLAKQSAEEKSSGGNLMDMAKDVASGGSAEDQIYKSFKDKLSGMNFQDILDYAG